MNTGKTNGFILAKNSVELTKRQLVEAAKNRIPVLPLLKPDS